MIVLLLIFVGPIILGAHLLGASWEASAFIGLVFYPAALLLVLGIAGLLDAADSVRRKRRFRKRQTERGMIYDKNAKRWVPKP